MPAKAKYVRKEWAVFFNQHNTRWYRAQPDRATALEVEKEANRRMRAGEDLRPPDKRPVPAERKPVSTPTGGTPFQPFAIQWMLDGWDTHKASSNDWHETQLRVHLFPALGDTPIEAIDRKRVKKILKDLIGAQSKRTARTLRNKTREAVHAVLCAVLEAAFDQGLITSNPALRIKTKEMRDPDQLDEEVPVWTPVQAEAFLTACQTHFPRWFPFFFVALRCGPRIGELAELRWEKDFTHPHKLLIQRAFSYRRRTRLVVHPDGSYRKERMPGQERVTTTKGKRRRLLDLYPTTEAVLRDHKIAARAEAFQRGQPCSLVFTGDRGARLSDVTIGRLMRKIEALAHVPRLTIHGLRHTYASVNLARGEELDYISKQLGHADISTTERVYRHFIPDDAASLARRQQRHETIWKTEGESAEGSK